MAEFISFQPSDFFNTTLYTGTGVAIGSGGTAFTGVGFQGDLWWGKQRNGTYRHQSYDSVRGVEKYLAPNTTEVESAADPEGFTAWGADGFTLGDRAQSNVSAGTFVCWNWKMGTTSGIAGSPSITPSSYSFNATAGQSIIAYTGNATSGATLPHGLGVAPKMIIVKALESADPWTIYHSAADATAPEDKYMVLNTSAAVADADWAWNDTAPTSTLFSLGNAGEVNASGSDYIAYCFAEKKGYSSMGSYTGNGSADGPFIYTGFRPGFLLFKRTDSTGYWRIYNTAMDPSNVSYRVLFPNDTNAENTTPGSSTYDIDLLSNGFKIRTTIASSNASGGTWIYSAFAEFPIVSSNDVPTVAR